MPRILASTAGDIPGPVRSKIVKEILSYFAEHGRQFPWRETREPYTTLVTEVMLRKTTACKLLHCWEKFFHVYPRVHMLANSDPEDIEAIIFPLGLQRQRSRGLKTMATQIVEGWAGRIPRSYDHLVELHGVGPYSANATLCFAYGELAPIVDVNVARLYGRLLGREFGGDIYNDKVLRMVAYQVMPRRKLRIREFSYGLLDFGSQICRSVSPRCHECRLIDACDYAGGQQ